MFRTALGLGIAASLVLLLVGHTSTSAELNTLDRVNGKPAEEAADNSGKKSEITPETERAIRDGTGFLLKTMRRDGGCGTDIGTPSAIGCPAMVGMALLSQGNTPVAGQNTRAGKQIPALNHKAQ